jgi:hypothetical protein
MTHPRPQRIFDQGRRSQVALGIEQALDEAGKRHHLILEERNLHHPAR